MPVLLYLAIDVKFSETRLERGINVMVSSESQGSGDVKLVGNSYAYDNL